MSPSLTVSWIKCRQEKAGPESRPPGGLAASKVRTVEFSWAACRRLSGHPRSQSHWAEFSGWCETRFLWVGNAGVTQSPSKTAQSPGGNFLQWCLLPFLAFDEGWVLVFDLCSVEIKRNELGWVSMDKHDKHKRFWKRAQDSEVFYALEIFIRKESLESPS